MITILTHNKSKNFKIIIRNLIKYAYLFFAQKLYLDLNRFVELLKFSGHVDVTKSLLSGLNDNKILFNVNPKRISKYYKNVIVLSGYDELNYAIELKRKKIIDCLLAGPNICILPSDIGNVFAQTEINKIITPSKWVSDSYIKDLPQLNNKIIEWPAGVDINYWKPKYKNKKESVLIYLKKPFSKKNIKKYIEIIKARKIQYKIIKYGFYNKNYFLKVLQKSKYCIFFSISESQGIAMLESWSSGTPSLVFDNSSIMYKKNKIISDTSPYLTKDTGLKFKDVEEFKEKLKYIELNYYNYHPRLWVTNNLTNKLSSKILIDIIT